MASVFHAEAADQLLNPFEQCIYIVSKQTTINVLTDNGDGNVVSKPRLASNDKQLWYLQFYGNVGFTINAYKSAPPTVMGCNTGAVNDIIILQTINSNTPPPNQLWQYDGDHVITATVSGSGRVLGVNNKLTTSNRITLVPIGDSSYLDQRFSFDSSVPSYWCITNDQNYLAGKVLEASYGVVNYENKSSTGNNQLWHFDFLMDGTFQICFDGPSKQYAAYGDGYEVHLIDPQNNIHAYTTKWKGTPTGNICTTTGSLVRYLQTSPHSGAVYVDADSTKDTLIFKLEKFTPSSLLVGKETSV